MEVSLLVPYRPDGAERERNWRFLRARYEALYPDWEIIEGSCAGSWSKGAAVADAAGRAGGSIFIVADADILIAKAALTEAVAALDHAPWVIPHGHVYRLTEKATQGVISGELVVDPTRLRRRALERPARQGPAGGGVAVTRAEDFGSVGGIDERFCGWGGEDISFARALDTLVGPHVRLDSLVWHLRHQPAPKRPGFRGSPESEALAGRYLEANGDRIRMAKLCSERPYHGLSGGGAVVARRHLVEEVPMDPRFTNWGQEDESWARALACLAGEPERGKAPLVHMAHPSPQRMTRRRGSPENWKLSRRYRAAWGDEDAMRALVSEGQALARTEPELVAAG